MPPRSSCFSSRSARCRLMIGCEGWTLQSLWRTSRQPEDQRAGRYAQSPKPRPRGTSLAAANLVCGSLRLGGDCYGFAVTAPLKIAAVRPHPVHDHRQLPRNRDGGTTDPAPLGDGHAPGLERRPARHPCQQGMRRQEQRLPRKLVSAFADRAVTVDLAGRILARRQAEMAPTSRE